MLQPCMKNKRECKVAVFDKKALYVTYSTSMKRGLTFVLPHIDTLFTFAQNAVNQLSTNCPQSLTSDSLIRVDIFQNKDLKLVVNEFESFEARIWPADDRNGNILFSVQEKQARFWVNEIIKLVNLYLKTKNIKNDFMMLGEKIF